MLYKVEVVITKLVENVPFHLQSSSFNILYAYYVYTHIYTLKIITTTKRTCNIMPQ